MALTPPPIPSGPPPPPPGVLVYEVDVPRPGSYTINIAVGDANATVSNQQVQIYDGTTLISTLFTGKATSAPDTYIDAQGNVLTASQWAVMNASVTLIFQTTKVVFYIGDGVHSSFLAALQVRDVVGTQTNVVVEFKRSRPVWKFRRGWRLRRKLLPTFAIALKATVRQKKPRPMRYRKPLAVRRLRKPYPFVTIFHLPLPRRKPPVWKRKRWQLKRKAYTPVAFKPPLVLPFHPLPHPKLKRRRWTLARKKYPYIGFVLIPPPPPHDHKHHRVIEVH